MPGLDARLRTLVVDPEDERRVYAGTRDGTLLFTLDGGRSWQERPVTPFVVDATRERTPAGRDLLDGLRPRYDAQPILRVVVCPGAPHPLMAVTPSALFGSRDGGVSYLRLFGAMSQERLRTVHCDPRCPGRIALASERGLYLSEDGGSSFGAASTPPGIRVDVAEVDCEAGRPASVWVAQDRRLYHLSVSGGDGRFRAVYPGPAPPGELPAPIGSIQDLEVHGSEVWLATDRGIQRSRDRGQTWAALPTDVGRFVRQIRVDRGGGRVAAVLDLSSGSRLPGASLNAIAVVSEDAGATWKPLFAGLSRRRVRWLGAGSGGTWWLATSSGVWTERGPVASPSALASRAVLALAEMPPLHQWMQAALQQANLQAEVVADVPARYRSRCWWPKLVLEGVGRRGTSGRQSSVRLDRVEAEAYGGRSDRLELMGWLSWELGCGFDAGARASGVRTRLQALRERIAFTVQEAFHERANALERIGMGVEEGEAWQLWARAEAMGAVLRTLSETH